MQNVAAAHGQSAVRDRGIELLQFGLELFIDQQQRFQRAADIAVAGRHDLVDGGLAWIGNHLKALQMSPWDNGRCDTAFLWIAWTGKATGCGRERAIRWQKCRW